MVLNTANQVIPYPEPTDKPADTPLFVKNLALAVEKKLAMVFVDSSDRGSKVATPVAGMMSVLTGPKVVEFYDGAAWVRIYPPPGPVITRGTVVPPNTSGVDGDVFMKY